MRATGPNAGRLGGDKNATFGQRLAPAPPLSVSKNRSTGTRNQDSEGGVEISWVPSSSRTGDGDDMLVEGSGKRKSGKDKRKGVEVFGAGMEKGGEDMSVEISESDRQGRTHRRKGVRSGSKNVFRRMEG